MAGLRSGRFFIFAIPVIEARSVRLRGFSVWGVGKPRWAKALERVKGIEPSYAAWEAAVLPLNYTRSESLEEDATFPRAGIVASTSSG